MRKKKFIILLVSIFTFIMLIGGVSYSYFVYNKDISNVSLDTGNISISFTGSTNNFSMSNLLPMSDSLGKDLSNYLDFEVNGTVDTDPILYELIISPRGSNNIDTEYIRLYLTDQDDNKIVDVFSYNELYNSMKNNGKSLYQGLIENNPDGSNKTVSKEYRLRIWIDEQYTGNNNGFNYSIYLYAKNIDETGNLLYGLEDIGETTSKHMKYSINNEIITVTALRDDGFGYIAGRVYLEAGKTYICNYHSDGIYGETPGTDTIEVFLMHTTEYIEAETTPDFYVIILSSNYEFTPQESGLYKLRLDVNKNGETHKFWDMSIREKNNPSKLHKVTFEMGNGRELYKYLLDGEDYGSLPTPKRFGYTFTGWNGKNLVQNLNIGIRIFDSTGDETTGNGYASSDYIPVNVDANNSYYISGLTDQLYSFIAFYDSNKTFLGRTAGASRTYRLMDDYIDSAHVTSNDIRYMRITEYENINTNGTIDIVSNLKLQLEKGNVATEYEPYYVTSNTKFTKRNDEYIMNAIYEPKEATFITGTLFNVKIKELAGTDTSDQLIYPHNKFDYNIYKIKRSYNLPSWFIPNNNNTLSVIESEVPIYGWFDNDTIFYFTEAPNPFTNPTTHSMFRSLVNVKEIDLNTLNTSKTVNTNAMFFNLNNLESIDLKEFDTSMVEDFDSMFDMYSGNNVLHKIDLSSFDMSNATTASNFLDNLTGLTEIVTPKVYPTDPSIIITLPNTFYDQEGHSYTTLSNTSPTSTILKTSW